MDTTPQLIARPDRAAPVVSWRRPLADLIDLALLAAGAVTAGGAAWQAQQPVGGDAWAELGAALLAAVVGGLVALGLWVGLLVRTARRGPTPGELAMGLDPGRGALMAALHHLCLAVALALLATAASSTYEPGVLAPLATGTAVGIAAGLLVGVHGRGAPADRGRVVLVAAVVGVVAAGLVPDRAPYSFELRDDATAAMITTLDEDAAAERACADTLAGVPLASHTTTPCYDPDRVWYVAAGREAVAADLQRVVEGAVGGHAEVVLATVDGQLEVQVADRTVAIIRSRPDCSTEVVLDGYETPVPDQQRPTCA